MPRKRLTARPVLPSRGHQGTPRQITPPAAPPPNNPLVTPSGERQQFL